MLEIDPIKLGSNNNIIITHPRSAYYYIPIPKNASSYSYDFFKQINWKYYQVDDLAELNNKKKIILLRDPIEKWCSGYAQDYFLNRFNLNLDDDRILDSIFENCYHGTHTLTQFYFIKNFDKNETFYIKVDGNLIKNIELFVSQIMNRKLLINKKIVQGKSIMDYQIKFKIQQALQNPKYLLKLKEYLQDDISLYTSAKFYNG